MRGGADDLLEVIQEQEELSVAQEGQQTLFLRLGLRRFRAQGPGDGRKHQLRLGDGGQRDKADPGAKVLLCPFGDRQGQARLANASGPGQGQQSHLIAQ